MLCGVSDGEKFEMKTAVILLLALCLCLLAVTDADSDAVDRGGSRPITWFQRLGLWVSGDVANPRFKVSSLVLSVVNL